MSELKQPEIVVDYQGKYWYLAHHRITSVLNSEESRDVDPELEQLLLTFYRASG